MRSIYYPESETLAEAERIRLAKLEEKTKSTLRRLDRLEMLTDEIHAQNETLAVLMTKLDMLTSLLEKQDERLSELENIPKHRYTTIIGAAITSLISAVIGGAVTIIF